MKIGIVANGLMHDFAFHRKILDECDIVIAADGGVNYFPSLKMMPNYVVGDLDSADEKILYKYLKKGSIVIKDTNQNKTDLELAIELALEHKAKEIVIIGAISTRFDHTLGNAMTLANLKIKAKIIDDQNEIFCVSKKIELKGKKGEIISIIPISEVSGLKYTGLKWNVEKIKTSLGWIGICNEFKNTKATIELKKGRILVMRCID